MQIVPSFRRLFACGLVLALIPALVSAEAPAEIKDKPAPTLPSDVRNNLDKSLAAVPIKPGCTLKDVLDILEEKAKLTFEIDEKAFAAEGATNVLATDVSKGDPGDLKNVKAKDVLRTVLKQVVISPGVPTYVVVGDRVVLTTETHAPYRLAKQRVSLDCEKEELSSVLKKLARKTGMSLVVDGRAAKEAEKPVTMDLQDETLETAVVLLAETVGLKPVRVGNTLFLTTKDNARKMCFPKPILDPQTGLPVQLPPSSLIGPCPLPDEIYGSVGGPPIME